MPSRNRAKAARRVITADCETDPFAHGRKVEPFLWCAYDPDFHGVKTFTDTGEFIEWASQQNALIYAHNGGRFDWAFVYPHIKQYTDEARFKMVNGRVLSVPLGKAILKDSLAILPIALKEYQKTDIKIWKLEREYRERHWQEIVDYCISDCQNLHTLITYFRQEAGKRDTIASNALAYAKSLGIEPGRTNAHFDATMRPFYFGGRCEARYLGHFFDAHSFDIKSAYPYAMTFDHPSGREYVDLGKYWTSLTREQLQRCMIRVTCYSDGAFPERTQDGLQFPRKRGTFCVTGWELVTALDHNLVSALRVENCYSFTDTINFKEYVDHWFARKQDAKNNGDKAREIIAKIMLNSLYGKLCENPTKYCDYKMVEVDTPLEYGWEIYETGHMVDIWYREKTEQLLEKWGDEWEDQPIFRNTATGASITGFTRAMLLDAMCRVGREHVLYMDTDSLIVTRRAHTGLLRRDGALGAWEHEAAATSAAIGGKKLYAMRLCNGKTKTACKGARPSAADIERVVDGYEIVWENPAPTFKPTGEHTFMRRTIRRADKRSAKV